MNDSFRFAPPSAQLRRLRSSANGVVYELGVWCPPARGDGNRYPVVYVLDGEDFFGTFVEAIARASRRPDATAVQPAIVVGIARVGSDEGSRGGAADGRHEDYTGGPPAEEAPGERRVGGAESFLSFIETELMPSIERELPADPARRILFGHSLAGYFALHAMATRPRMCDAYVAVSPSIWWDEAGLHAAVGRLEAPFPRVFIAVGEWEGALPPWQRESPAAARTIARRERRGMIDRAQRFSAHLGEVIGHRNVAFHLFPDEDHASVALVAIARALRFALRVD